MSILVLFANKTVEYKAPGELLEPLSVAEKPWNNVTVNFITCLPNSKSCGMIDVLSTSGFYLKENGFDLFKTISKNQD